MHYVPESRSNFDLKLFFLYIFVSVCRYSWLATMIKRSHAIYSRYFLLCFDIVINKTLNFRLSQEGISFRFSKLLKTFRQEISQSFIKTHLSQQLVHQSTPNYTIILAFHSSLLFISFSLVGHLHFIL